MTIRKYVTLYKAELMTSLQYTLNVLFRLVGYVIHIFIFMKLWEYIYDDPTKLINGYSKTQMIWYVICTEVILAATEGRKFCRKICNEVKGGNIAYILNKPYSYIGYILSSHLGESAIKTIIGIIISLAFGLAFVGNFPTIPIFGYAIVIVSGIMAVIINMMFVILIGLLSFIMEDANPIFWIYSKIILIIGVMFPVEFFPTALQGIIKFSPVYVVCYGPAKLFVDFSYEKAGPILLAQILYLVFVWMMCNLLYKKGVKKLYVNGG